MNNDSDIYVQGPELTVPQTASLNSHDSLSRWNYVSLCGCRSKMQMQSLAPKSYSSKGKESAVKPGLTTPERQGFPLSSVISLLSSLGVTGHRQA